MRLVYLVRHASPVIQPATPAEEWKLSERGIGEARRLADTAKGWGLQAIYSSPEPKAMSTALILAEDSGLMVHAVEGFYELRLGGDFIHNADEFSETIRSVLERPDQAVRGSERASAAAARFAAGMRIVEEGPFPAAVVSHGRVIVSYLAHERGFEDPFALWQSIPMPGWACLDLDVKRGRLVREFQGV
jgi:broad specificity phosphatase PhoE